MFTKESRTNVDNVEQDFFRFKMRVGEVEESIVERFFIQGEYVPTLLDRPLTDGEIEKLVQLRPWGYSFRIDKTHTAFDMDIAGGNPASGSPLASGDPAAQAPKPVDHGLIEMDLRMSILRSIFGLFGPAKGESWLDIATNCGIIPLFLNRESVLKVSAIDLFAGNIEKANYLAHLSGKSSCSFSTGDAYTFLSNCEDNSFDTISALGLFYHLSDPIGLLNLMYQKSRRMVIIDTVLHNFDFSGWIQTISRHVKFSNLAHANDTRKILEMHPTFRGLVDALFQVGFDKVIEASPSPDLLARFPAQIYKDRNRAFLVAFKNR